MTIDYIRFKHGTSIATLNLLGLFYDCKTIKRIGTTFQAIPTTDFLPTQKIHPRSLDEGRTFSNHVTHFAHCNEYHQHPPVRLQ